VRRSGGNPSLLLGFSTPLKTIILLFYFVLVLFWFKIYQGKRLSFLQHIILCILFILIGFSTWMMLPVRANANTVINENKPSDATEVLITIESNMVLIHYFTAHNILKHLRD
jgi:hypothetical protein